MSKEAKNIVYGINEKFSLCFNIEFSKLDYLN